MKIGALTVIIVGLSIGVSVLAYAFFHHWVPNRKQTSLYHERMMDHEKVMAQMPAAIKKVNDAKALVEAKKNEWRQIASTRTIPADLKQGGVDLTVHRLQLAMDMPVFRDNIQKALNAQLKAGGVRVVQGPRIPDPPNDPNGLLSYVNYPAMPFPVVIFDLGQITVQGTYKQITDNMRAWSRMPKYLAVADRLQLQGTSPVLTGTYNLSIVGFIQERQVSPPIPLGGGGGGGGGGGAGGSGAPRRIGGRMAAG